MWTVAIAYCLASFTLLTIAFQLEAGWLQLVMLGAGMLLAAGTTGPTGAMVANLTSWPVHATAFAILTLANNILGLAPGPFLTGILADRIGLLGALQLVPLASLVATAAFVIGKRHYVDDLRRGDADSTS
jgi:hypothetical protein